MIGSDLQASSRRRVCLDFKNVMRKKQQPIGTSKASSLGEAWTDILQKTYEILAGTSRNALHIKPPIPVADSVFS